MPVPDRWHGVRNVDKIPQPILSASLINFCRFRIVGFRVADTHTSLNLLQD
jgi:hypothetical protein